MDCQRQLTIFILTYFLLTSCLCSEATRSKRQKRGIMKMMMHIMWDPVRLIRYWYAYDVTKEIAKSWRKILPTILLLPVTQNNPHSHGFAKYVHPTNGVRDSNKKIKAKHPSIPFGTYYQGSAGNIKPVAILPNFLPQGLPPGYAYEPSHPPIQYYSSREIENTSKYKHKNIPHVIVGEVPYEADKNGNQYSIAHYFVGDGTSREETHSSNIFFPGQTDYNTEDDIRSSSTHHMVNNGKRKIHPSINSILQHHHKNYIPHGESHGSFHEENGRKVSPVLHPGQEFHIVLHPIPVRDFDSHSLKPTSNGQSIQFVPVQVQSNHSYGIKFDASPILLKAVPQNSAESDKSDEGNSNNSFKLHEDRVTEIPSVTARNDKFDLNSSDTNMAEEIASAEDVKSRVTWILQKCENQSMRAYKKESDLKPNVTTKRSVSVHRNNPQKYKFNKDNSSGYVINRNNINMERLREDLKHGTPVLIPFNRNTYSSDIISDTDFKNSKILEHDNKKHMSHDLRTHGGNSKVLFKPITRESGINLRGEQSGERNATQKLILFIKKTKNP